MTQADIPTFEAIASICSFILTPVLSGTATWAVLKYRMGTQEKQLQANSLLIDSVASHAQSIDGRVGSLEVMHKGVEGFQNATQEDIRNIVQKLDKLSGDVSFLRGASEGNNRGGRRAQD